MRSDRWTIGFDADDTLWQHERYYQSTQAHFSDLLAAYTAADHLAERLLAAESRNLGQYGFGVKGFVLSMIETAIEVTDARVPASVIAAVLDIGRDMLNHPIELMPHARQAVTALAGRAELVLITKGDLLDQERKLAQSGLGDLFDAVEIVSDKSPDVYRRIFARHGAIQSMMVGNSVKSDVIPAITAGAWGVHVPAQANWVLDHAHPPVDHPRFREIATLGDLADLLDTIESDPSTIQPH